MEVIRINRLESVSAEQAKAGKRLAGQQGKNEATVSLWCANSSQLFLEMLWKMADVLDIDAWKLINNSNNEDGNGKQESE